MIDPELKYCPQCKEEYMPHAVNCASCEITLVSGVDLLAMEKNVQVRRSSRPSTIAFEDDIVVVFHAVPAEVKQIEQLLTQENIVSLITDDGQSCGEGCCTGSFLLSVHRGDAMDALKIIEQEYDRTTGLSDHDHNQSIAEAVFDPTAQVATCPACGTTFSPDNPECPECGLCF